VRLTKVFGINQWLPAQKLNLLVWLKTRKNHWKKNRSETRKHEISQKTATSSQRNQPKYAIKATLKD
jgi:hypothetical protein